MPRTLLLILIPFLFAGCAIDRKPLRQSTTAFEEIDPATPARGERGPIEIGYTPEMVQRALGEPASIRAKPSGISLEATWTYPDNKDGDLHVTFRRGQVAEIRRENSRPTTQ